MPPEMLAWLCEFCYIDLPCALVRRLARGPFPLREACDAFLQTPPCEELSAFAQQALRTLRETRLLVLHYVNRNAGTGFVGYSFLAPDESVTLALRGSESGPCAPSLVDWADNFAAPFAGSVQYQDIYRLVNRYPAGPLTITGHSKGGHNALYALAVARNPQARAVAFNGQGFRRDQLDRAQKARLRAQAINYVTRSDIVGALLYHPETREFCAARLDENAHALSAFLFQPDGYPVPAGRTCASRAIEAASRIALHGLRSLQSSATING